MVPPHNQKLNLTPKTRVFFCKERKKIARFLRSLAKRHVLKGVGA